MADDTRPTGATGRRTLCLTGPESTGKTTLAEALAEHFGAVLVPEVAREYLAERDDYQADDVLAIAQLQMAAEAVAHDESSGLVVCDTDLLVIRVWWEEKYGDLPAELANAYSARTDRAYLLLEPDLPWSADPLRENPDDQDRLYERYAALLAEGRHPYDVVAGSGAGRLTAALRAIAGLLPDIR